VSYTDFCTRKVVAYTERACASPDRQLKLFLEVDTQHMARIYILLKNRGPFAWVQRSFTKRGLGLHKQTADVY